MSRILRTTTMVCLLLCACIATGRAQTNAALRCRVDAAPVAVGGQATLVIEVADVQDLYAYELTMTYDPSLVQVQDGDAGEEGVNLALGDFLSPDFVLENEVDSAAGRISLTLTQLAPSEPKNGTGVLAQATLLGARAGVATFTLDALLTDRDGGAIDAAIEGCFAIVGQSDQPTPTPTPTAATATPTTTPTVEPTATSQPPTATNTPVPTATFTPLPPTATAAETAEPTATSQPPTATETPTATDTVVVYTTPTPTITPTASETPTASATPVPTATPTLTPTATPSASPTVTPAAAEASTGVVAGVAATDTVTATEDPSSAGTSDAPPTIATVEADPPLPVQVLEQPPSTRTGVHLWQWTLGGVSVVGAFLLALIGWWLRRMTNDQ